MEPATVQSLNPQGDLVVGVDGSQESFGALRVGPCVRPHFPGRP